MDINKKIEDALMDYSAYVLLHRCLPDVRDGLKPVHRQILYSMYKNKTFDFTKSANVSGEVMKYCAHGDTYPTIVNLTQKDKQIVPFITGKGSFGQHTSRDLQPAASRYSEVKLSDMAVDMLSNLDKNMVQFVDNYDGKRKLPVCLPVKYPSILCYTNIGIGVGMSSSICSFNMNEVNEQIICYLKNGTKNMLIPDFATGANLVMNNQDIETINTHGIGSIVLKAKCNIVKNVIYITEIPYSTTREAIIDKIVKLVKDGKIKQITAVKDLTDLKGMCIEITCRKNCKPQEILELLYKTTPLQNTFSVQMRMLVDGLPKVLGVWSVIDKWLQFRTECIINGLTHDIKVLNERIHILNGFKKIVHCIDNVIDTIRKCEDSVLTQTIMDKYCLDETQANYIIEMKLRQLNKTYIEKQLNELDGAIKTVQKYSKIIDTPKLINDIIIKSLQDVNKKFKTPRRSIIC